MANGMTTQSVQNYGFYNPAMYNMPMGMNGFNGMMPQLQMPQTDYSNDIFAPSFIKNPNSYNMGYYNNTQPQQVNTPQNTQPQQSIFNQQQGQTQYIQPSAQTFTGNPQESLEPTENGNVYEKTNTGKTLFTLAGVCVPVLTTGYKVFKGAKLSDVLKYKELGLKGLALGIAGWCIGSLIDGFINNSRAQTVDNASQNIKKA
jgi:hypothetical protein